jgi:flagellar basal-body rod protein FlgB
MIGKLDEYMRFNETALSLRAQRQELIASNIANADTPNYKARDIDFASALQSALAATTPPAGVLVKTAPGHIGGSGQSGDFLPNGTPVQYRVPAQGSADNNTVDMDVERNQFADNGLRYEAAVTFLNSQIRGLMTAINGGQ